MGGVGGDVQQVVGNRLAIPIPGSHVIRGCVSRREDQGVGKDGGWDQLVQGYKL